MRVYVCCVCVGFAYEECGGSHESSGTALAADDNGGDVVGAN